MWVKKIDLIEQTPELDECVEVTLGFTMREKQHLELELSKAKLFKAVRRALEAIDE